VARRPRLAAAACPLGTHRRARRGRRHACPTRAPRFRVSRRVHTRRRGRRGGFARNSR
jgi:hypothetical protein